MISAFLAFENQLWPQFAEKVIGVEALSEMERSYSNADSARQFGVDSQMFGFYIGHNASIGLECFVTMTLVLPGMVTLGSNAVQLGTAFGYMFRAEAPDASINFQNFVTAHGPFELTAIVLSAGAGLKIGLGWVKTNGMRRIESFVKAAREALPIAMCAMILFCLAAAIEGFVSPTDSARMPWVIKGIIGLMCSFVLMIYFVILGFPEHFESKGNLL